MNELLFFILGFIAAQYLIPFFDNLLVLILTKLEVKKTKYSEAINQCNINMRKAADEEPPRRLIGFNTSSAEEEEEEEEYEV